MLCDADGRGGRNCGRAAVLETGAAVARAVSSDVHALSGRADDGRGVCRERSRGGRGARSWLQTVRFLVILAALGAVAAARARLDQCLLQQLQQGHRRAALVASLARHRHGASGRWSARRLCVIHECQEGSKDGSDSAARCCSARRWSSISGFLGSALIYGLDHYAWK